MVGLLTLRAIDPVIAVNGSGDPFILVIVQDYLGNGRIDQVAALKCAPSIARDIRKMLVPIGHPSASGGFHIVNSRVNIIGPEQQYCIRTDGVGFL